MNIVASGITSL